MFKFSSRPTLITQLVITFSVSTFIYAIMALFENEGGIDGMFGFLFSLIIAWFLSWLNILIVFIIGLPIRTNYRIFKWWTSHSYIAITLIISGFILLFLANTTYFESIVVIDSDEQNELKRIPNFQLQITGWFLITFSTFHLFPPYKAIFKLK